MKRIRAGALVAFSMVIMCAGMCVAACGGGAPPERTTTPDDDIVAEPVAPAPRTELEVRTEAACEALGPRLTDCAIADARATMSAEELAKLDLEKTAPVHTRKFIDGCKEQQLSSRQVRVYEVCMREESACEPLLACLEHARPDAADGAPPATK